MSVLKAHRGQSKAEYCNTANAIYVETLGFLSRLSARYSRLLAQDAAHLASEVVTNAEKANSMMPSDEIRYNERKAFLLRARAALVALDLHLARVYEVLLMNPEGAFQTTKGKNVPIADAMKKLDHMAQSLGEKIDEEEKMLNGVMKSDKQYLAKKMKEK